MRYARPELRAAASRCPTARSPRRRSQALATGFADAHRQRYGFVADGEPVQIVTLRVEATGVGAQGRRSRRIPTPGRMRRGAIVRRPRRCGCPRRATSSTARSMPATRCARATASPAPRSSSRWTPPRSCLPGMTARVDPYLNLILESHERRDSSACARRSTRSPSRSSARALSSIVEETGETLIRASLLDQHQGAARLLDGAVQRRRRDAVPGRAHPDPSRQLHRHRPAHHAALPDARTSGRATSSSATTPTRAAARTCPTSCSPSRSSSTAASSPGR